MEPGQQLQGDKEIGVVNMTPSKSPGKETKERLVTRTPGETHSNEQPTPECACCVTEGARSLQARWATVDPKCKG
eukprot:363885-Chlamydomonas_euryale.AAC.19